MTNKKILESTINLSKAYITEEQKKIHYKVLPECREAFSLRDKIGLYSNVEVTLELANKTPFYIRLFPVKEGGKITADREMTRVYLLRIIIKGLSVSLHLLC